MAGAGLVLLLVDLAIDLIVGASIAGHAAGALIDCWGIPPGP